MQTKPPLTTGLIAVLAIAAGTIVANIYYNQPLLELLARRFDVTSAGIGQIAVATQLGYASGLLFVVPLGDTTDRRKLIIGTAAGAALLLLGIAAAPSLPVLIGLSFAVGLLSVTPQLIVPYAAGLADPRRRGHVVGVVMSGLLIGILCARAFAGFAGAWFGWRMVFVLGAAVSAITALLLLRIPRVPSAHALSYPQLLRSLPALMRREPVLQRHSIIGALGFAAFSVFWTTLGFYLAQRPEHFGSRTVGLFGLVAVAGALVAPIAGRLSDRWGPKIMNGLSLATMLVGFWLMSFANRSLALLVVAVFIMDAGVQANQISNQARIYALAPELRNRITSVYMVTYFVGGALGSAIGAQAWSRWGWTGVWGTAAALSFAAFIPLFAIVDGTKRAVSSASPVKHSA